MFTSVSRWGRHIFNFSSSTSVYFLKVTQMIFHLSGTWKRIFEKRWICSQVTFFELQQSKIFGKNIKYSQTKRNFFSRLFRFMLVYGFSTVTDWLSRKGFLKPFVTYATRILNCKKEHFKTIFHINWNHCALLCVLCARQIRFVSKKWCLMTKFIEKWSSWKC